MSYVKRLLILLVVAVPLMGFGSCQTKVKTPDKVYITVEKMPELTPKQKKHLQDCPIEEPKKITVEESVRVASERKTSLANCNVDKKEIRSWFDK